MSFKNGLRAALVCIKWIRILCAYAKIGHQNQNVFHVRVNAVCGDWGLAIRFMTNAINAGSIRHAIYNLYQNSNNFIYTFKI